MEKNTIRVLISERRNKIYECDRNKFTNFSSTEREELKKQLRQELAEEIIDSKRCKNCKFFRQHYAKATLETPWAKDDFFKVDGGHCTAVRIKNRKPDTPACALFEFSPDTLVGCLLEKQ